jgi:hypothetical protein
LFDRKINKLLQEADFYENELNAKEDNECMRYLEELVEIKNDSISSHKSIITDLTALIV